MHPAKHTKRIEPNERGIRTARIRVNKLNDRWRCVERFYLVRALEDEELSKTKQLLTSGSVSGAVGGCRGKKAGGASFAARDGDPTGDIIDGDIIGDIIGDAIGDADESDPD